MRGILLVTKYKSVLTALLQLVSLRGLLFTLTGLLLRVMEQTLFVLRGYSLQQVAAQPMQQQVATLDTIKLVVRLLLTLLPHLRQDLLRRAIISC